MPELELEEQIALFRNACLLILNLAVTVAGYSHNCIDNYGARTYVLGFGMISYRVVIAFKSKEELHLSYDNLTNACVIEYITANGMKCPERSYVFSEPLAKFDLPIMASGFCGWVNDLQRIILYFIDYYAEHKNLEVLKDKSVKITI